MNKKFYEAPSQEIVELEVATALLVGSENPDNPFDGGGTAGTEEME